MGRRIASDGSIVGDDAADAGGHAWYFIVPFVAALVFGVQGLVVAGVASAVLFSRRRSPAASTTRRSAAASSAPSADRVHGMADLPKEAAGG